MSMIAVWGAHQAGKTTLSINMAHALSRNDHNVLLISPLEYSEISVLMGINIPPENSLLAALSGAKRLRKVAIEAEKNLYILAAATRADAFEMIVSDEQAKELLNESLLAFDDIIIDCPSDKSNLLSAWSLNKADFVLLTFGGKASHTIWAESNYRALKPLWSRCITVINETVAGFDYDTMKELLKCTDTASTLPHVPNAAQLANEQKFIYGNGVSSKVRRYTEAMNELLTRVVI